MDKKTVGLSDTFKEHIKPYRSQIDTKDEAFFLKTNYEEFEENEEVTNVINQIKEYWNEPSLSQKNKDTIWQYVITLTTLSDKL